MLPDNTWHMVGVQIIVVEKKDKYKFMKKMTKSQIHFMICRGRMLSHSYDSKNNTDHSCE